MSERRNKVLLLLVVLTLILPCCNAVNVSFIKSVPYITDYNVQVWSGGNMIGVYNTSSQMISLTDNGSYNFILYYPDDTMIAEPDAFAFGLLDKLQANEYGLVIGAMIVGILLFAVALAKRGR